MSVPPFVQFEPLTFKVLDVETGLVMILAPQRPDGSYQITDL